MNVKIIGSVAFTVAVAGGVFAAMQMGEKSPIIARGTLELSPELSDYAIGIQTVFITAFDESNPAPMPWGAMKEQITQDASGKFLDFLLTKERLRIMNDTGKMPASLRIKARLDKDGAGGMDQPGDIIGSTSGVAFGSTDVHIELNEIVGHADAE